MDLDPTTVTVEGLDPTVKLSAVRWRVGDGNENGSTFKERLEAQEREALLQTLRMADGNLTRGANCGGCRRLRGLRVTWCTTQHIYLPVLSSPFLTNFSR